MPWKPRANERFPSLGWHVADQMAEYLAIEIDDVVYPFEVTREQLEFLVKFYELDPITGRRIKQRGVLQRSRGWGKSPIIGAIGFAETVFEVVPDGWDSRGQPVAIPRSRTRARVNGVITATSEEQVANTWAPLLDMVRTGSAVDEFDIEPMETFISIGGKGKLEPRTSAGRSVKGLPDQVVAIMDQTEEWVRGNGGIRLAQNLRNNATKAGGVTLESPNAFTPGENSVAEFSARDWELIKSGKHPRLTEARQLLYDHREAPADTDPSDHDSLIAGLRYAYGDSSDHPDGCVIHRKPCPPGWAPIEQIALAFLDTSNDPQVLRADFLNQITHASDSWVSQPEIRAIIADGEQGRIAPPKILRTDPITLGFDGSEGRKDTRLADSTVLIAYSLRHKYAWPIGIWEQPDGPEGVGWRPPALEIEKVVDDTFKKHNVVGFYADPSAGWAGQVKAWEAAYGRKLKAKLTVNEPIRWKQKDVSRTADTFEQLRVAIANGEVWISGDPRFVAHLINARRDPRRSGYVLKKPDHDQDYSKIDASYGFAFAFAAGNDAIGKGVLNTQRRMPRQIA